MEAIVAATRDNAYAVGLEGQLGEIAPGKRVDLGEAGDAELSFEHAAE